MAVDVTPNQDGGVLKEIIRAGTSDEMPWYGDQVSVHYVGTLKDGSQFDSSRDRDEMFVFTLGKRNVIKAWDMGVATMRRGEVARITARADYAYGQYGQGKILPHATLIFEIELIDFKGEDISPKKDDSITKRIIELGELHGLPNEGANVDVHIRGDHGGSVFDERTVTFQIGEASENNVIEGIELAVKKMTKGQKAQVVIAPKYAYGQKGNPDKGIPGDVKLTYQLTLNSFVNAKEFWQMDPDEKIEHSKMMKEKGVVHYKAGRYHQAIKMYKRVTDCVSCDDVEAGPDQRKEMAALRVAGHLNAALCHMKMRKFYKVIDHCDKVLLTEPGNVKGLFRRGQAKLAVQEFDGAVADFERCLEHDPENKAAKNNLRTAIDERKKFKGKEKNKYHGMFEKLAVKDAKAEEERRRNAPDMPKIDEWDNKMADGMLSIEKEAEAFRDHEAGAEGQLSEADELMNGS